MPLKNDNWGIMIFYVPLAGYNSFVMADDGMYDRFKQDYKRNNQFIGGRKGVTSDEIDPLADNVNGLVKRLNDSQKDSRSPRVNLKTELEVLGFSR